MLYVSFLVYLTYIKYIFFIVVVFMKLKIEIEITFMKKQQI